MDLTTIQPNAGLGALRFGMLRPAVRQGFMDAHDTFTRAEQAFEERDEEVDAYDALGLHLHYDENNALEYIELFPPASPTWDGLHLLDLSLEEIERVATARGYSVSRDETGLDIRSLGIGIYSENGSQPQAVSVYREGYYDDLDI